MQAVIITCYKDKKQLFNLINCFSKNTNFYIHIDKKSNLIDIEDFKNMENVYVIKKYNIGWGSLNHVYAIIDLLKEAIKNKNNKYYHILSGQDYMIKSASEFDAFFENNNNIYMCYMTHDEMPKETINRYKKGCFNSVLPANKKVINIFNKSCGLIRNKKGIGDFNEVYKGLIWSSMPNDVVKYILNYINENKKYMKDLKHCVIPEEFFFQTIILNSKFKNHVVNDDLRYNDWHFVNGSDPAYLDESYFEKINLTNDLFIQKVDSNISKKLIEMYKKGNGE